MTVSTRDDNFLYTNETLVYWDGGGREAVRSQNNTTWSTENIDRIIRDNRLTILTD